MLSVEVADYGRAMFHVPAHKNLVNPPAQFDASDGPQQAAKARKSRAKGKARVNKKGDYRRFVIAELYDRLNTHLLGG